MMDGGLKPGRCETLVANLPQYQLFSNAFKGGRFIRTPPIDTYDPAYRGLRSLAKGTYLKQLPNESNASFELRVARAAYRNYCQEIVRVYVATLFAAGTSMERQSVLERLPEGIAGDLDMRGTGISGFLRSAFREALIYGWVGCLTDFPAQDASIATRADETTSGRRPYSRLILPANLWGWELHPVTRDWEWILIHEGEHPWYGGEDVWLMITGESWFVIDEKGDILNEGPHTFDRIPFDVLVCDEPSADPDDEPFGHSALRDVADIQLELYQLSSMDEDLLRKVNFPFLHKKAQPGMQKKVESDLPVGPDYGITSEAEYKWIENTATASKTNMEKLAELERQIRQIAGIATRSEESTEAHSGVALSWEYSTKLSLVKLRAENLRDFEVRFWRTWGSLLGVDLEPSSVRYPSDYASAPVPEEISDLKDLREMGAPIEVQRAFLRSITLKQFAHRPDLSDLLDAVDAWDGGQLPGEGDAVETVAPTEKTASGVDLSEAIPQETALNGAQVTAMQGVITAAAKGELPRDTAVALLAFAFPMDTATAEKIIGSIGRGFEAEKPPPPPMPFASPLPPAAEEEPPAAEEEQPDA